MRLSWWWLPLLAAAAGSGGLGCSSAAADVAPSPRGVEGPNAAIAFDTQATLTLAPGEIREIGVSGSPPAPYEVTFVLLGDSLDASLGPASTVNADANGHATVTLRAPDAPTTFRLRASIAQGPSAEIAAAVSDLGFGSINVVPVYAGKRPVTQWTASVVARTTCAAIAQTLPAEPAGAIVATSASSQNPLITGAPVGPSLAVAIRAGHYMWGCADSTNLVAGSTLAVQVTVLDKPIDTSATDLDLDLVYAPDPTPYTALLASGKDLLAEGFFPSGAGYGKTLLDAMNDLVPVGSQDQFQARRSSQGWDDLVDGFFQQGNVSLRDSCKTWADVGLASEPQQILGHLSSIGDTPGHALFEVKSLGSVSAAAAGIPSQHVMSWSADPNDELELGGTVFWMPSRYVGATALKGAEQNLGSVMTISEALSKVADCDAISMKLGAIQDCDVACLSQTCTAALSARWQIGLEASASAGSVGEIAVTASGAATVNDTAAPLSLNGSWLGTVTDGVTSASVQGIANATTPTPN